MFVVYKVGQKQLFVGDAHTLEGRRAGSQILGSRKQQLLKLFKCLKYAFPLKVGVGNGVLAKALRIPLLHTSSIITRCCFWRKHPQKHISCSTHGVPMWHGAPADTPCLAVSSEVCALGVLPSPVPPSPSPCLHPRFPQLHFDQDHTPLPFLSVAFPVGCPVLMMCRRARWGCPMTLLCHRLAAAGTLATGAGWMLEKIARERRATQICLCLCALGNGVRHSMGSPSMRPLGMAALPPAHVSIPLGLHPGGIMGVALQLHYSMLLQTHRGFDGRQPSKGQVEARRSCYEVWAVLIASSPALVSSSPWDELEVSPLSAHFYIYVFSFPI